MITTHEERRAAARTTNNEPTMTDQSGAAEADLNVILRRYAQSGTITSHGKEPMYIDWTEYPEDFRGFLHMARDAERLKSLLPDQVKALPTDELLNLTAEQLTNILTPPPAPTPANTGTT